MIPVKRLKPLVQVAQLSERDAARRFGQIQEQLSGQETRLVELKAYRDDYFQRFRSAASSGLGAGKLQDYQRFLSKLNEAIAQLESSIAETRCDVETSRQGWLMRHTRSKALDKVAEQSRAQEAQFQARQEQSESDDRAQRNATTGVEE